MRKAVIEAVTKKAPNSPNEEARAWGEWLSEPSRMTALLMPEIGAEDCIRDRKLNKNLEDKEFEEDKNAISTVIGGPDWMQEVAGADADVSRRRIHSFSWTPKLRSIHSDILTLPSLSEASARFNDFEKEA